MNDERIDQLVRQHLDRDAATVDAAAMLSRVRNAPAESVSRRAWMRRVFALGGGAAIAAGVGGVLFFGPSTPKALASAEEILGEAKETHALPTDRLYDLTTEWNAPAFAKLQIPVLNRTFSVWTRGDLFWAQPADDANWCMGQDANGRVWFAFGRKRGLVYDASELGEPLMRYLDLVSLRFVSTLGELLEKFKLFRKDTGEPGEPIRIEAEIKPSFLNRNPRFQFIKLELDPVTKVVREASFERKVNDEPVGRIHFKLRDTASLNEKEYDVRGHLDADAEIVDRIDPTRNDRRSKFRDEFLKKLQARKR